MPQPAYLTIPAAVEQPESEVGVFTKELGQLHQAGIPLAETVVIPISVLSSLADQTHLTDKLSQVIKMAAQSKVDALFLKKQLTATMKQLALPNSFTSDLFEWYHQQTGCIRVAAVTDQLVTPYYDNIRGDANVLDSILTVWANQCAVDLEQKQVRVTLRPILLQVQPQATISGIANTNTPNHHKSVIAIKVVRGTYSTDFSVDTDEYLIDTRTFHIISRDMQPQFLQLVREDDRLVEKAVPPYLQEQDKITDENLITLARFISKIKHILYTQSVIEWEMVDHRILISAVHPHQQLPQSTSQSLVVASGQSVQGGIVNGTAKVIARPQEIKQLQIGEVLVVSHFTHEYLPALPKVAAILCEHGIDSPLLLDHLKQKCLPTVAYIDRATHLIHSGDQIVVDANRGKVLTQNKRTQIKRVVTQAPITLTKVFIAAGNPDQAAQYVTADVDGVGVLRSEFVFATFGQHPMHVLKSKQQKQLKQRIKDTISAYWQVVNQKNFPVIYRSQNFTSAELLSLDHATSYEPSEANPYLGFRGGIKILKQTELFAFELETINELIMEKNKKLGLLIPFVRTPGEFLLVTEIIKKFKLDQQPNFALYLQLNTPANILELPHYLRTGLVEGISVNVKSLHALLHGIDPDDPDIYNFYSVNTDLLKPLLRQVVNAIKHPDYTKRERRPTAFLHVEDEIVEVVELGVELGFDAITVKPSFANTTKRRVIELEEARILRYGND